MRKKHKRENKALKLLIWIAAAAGVTVVALFALLTSREQQQEHKNADKRQQAEPLVIEVPEQETEGSIRVFDYDGCCIYAYYGKIEIRNDGRDGKEIDIVCAGYLEGYEEHKEPDETGEREAEHIMNLERGHKEYEKVKYRYKDMTEAMYELSLLAGNGYTQELTAYEKTRLVERTKAALIRAKEEDGLEIKGKMRDLVAAMLNESSTNVARMESINNNATPEIKEQLKNGNMGITAAYEAAKLPEDEQREIAEQAAGGSIRAKEIAAKVAEKKAGDDYETPHPESITSLCYSCQRYKDCNVKTGTCEKCDQYINKAEEEKTDEQRYNEEQDRIDRETKKKLQEKADAEKMEHLPSDAKAKKYIRVSKQTFKAVCAGLLPYLLLKYEKYSAGEIAVIQEFEEGRATGKTKELYISCVDTEETHTAIAEGYCVLGILEKEIAVEKGWLNEVSETDTEGGNFRDK